MLKSFIFLSILVLAGCTIAAQYNAPEIISGNNNQVAIKSGIYKNPGILATEHCKKYGKTAVLDHFISQGVIYTHYFQCT